MPRRPVILVALLILAIFGIAATRATLHSQGDNPLANWMPSAQLAQLACPPNYTPVPGSLQITDTRISPDMMLLYHYRQKCILGTSQPIEVIGHQTFQLTWSGWQATGGSATWNLPPPQPQLVELGGVGWITGNGEAQTVVAGLVIGNVITSVSVLFGDGQHYVVRVTGGEFRVEAPGIIGVCTLQAWDGQGQLIQRIDLRANNQSPHQPMPVNCPPPSSPLTPPTPATIVPTKIVPTPLTPIVSTPAPTVNPLEPTPTP